VRRRPRNKLGFAIQLCVMRHTGRLLGEDEQPHAAVIRYLADQLGVDSRDYAIYARRVQTRFEHSRFLTEHLSLHIANKNDRRAALLAAIDAAAAGDKGHPIVTAVISAFRQRRALFPSQAAIETIGLAGRAIARRRAEITLLEDIAAEKLEALDALLHVDPAVGQTRFHWLRSVPDAPGASDEIDKRYFVTSPKTSASMFFGSTASLVFFRPDRPIHSRRAQGAVKAGRVLRGHRKAWALTDPSTAACFRSDRGARRPRGLAQLEIPDAVSYCLRARATSWRSVVHRLKAPPGRLIRALPD
jgi:hypothetical protein